MRRGFAQTLSPHFCRKEASKSRCCHVILELAKDGCVLLVGVILLVTGVIQKCPLNRGLGFNTYRQKKSSESEEPTVTHPK